jgi:hypothetical protein
LYIPRQQRLYRPAKKKAAEKGKTENEKRKYECKKCAISWDISRYKKTHDRNFHYKTMMVKFRDGESLQLHRLETSGMFHCPCERPNTSFQSHKLMLKHARRHESQPDKNTPPLEDLETAEDEEEEDGGHNDPDGDGIDPNDGERQDGDDGVIEQDEHDVYHPENDLYDELGAPPSSPLCRNDIDLINQPGSNIVECNGMEKYSIVVHIGHNLIICRPCKVAVLRHTLHSHLLGHELALSAADETRMFDGFENLLNAHPTTTPEQRQAPVPFISRNKGYRCLDNNCSYVTTSEAYMARHDNQQHSAKVSYEECTLQSWLRNPPRYYHVSGPVIGDPLPTSDDWQVYLARFPKPVITYATSTSVMSPFLRMMGWHDHIKNYPVDRIKFYVELSTKNEPDLAPLQKEVNHYLHLIMPLIMNGHDILRCWMLSNDGVIGHKLFKAPDLKTVDKYANALTTFVLMIFRTFDNVEPDDYVVPLSADQKTYVNNLRETLLQKDSVAIQSAIHTLLFSLFAFSIEQSPLNRPNPVERWIILTDLKYDGGFAPPHQITPRLAPLILDVRAVIYKQMLIEGAREGNSVFK